MAYSTTVHPDTLSTVATCLHDHEMGSTCVVKCFTRLHEVNKGHFGDTPYPSVALFTDYAANTLWLNTMIYLLDTEPADRDKNWEEMRDILDGYMCFAVLFTRKGLDPRQAEWALTVFSSLIWNTSGLLSNEDMVRSAVEGLDGIVFAIDMYNVSVSNTVVEYVAAAVSQMPADDNGEPRLATLCTFAMGIQILYDLERITVEPELSDTQRDVLRARVYEGLRYLSTTLPRIQTENISADGMDFHQLRSAITGLIDALPSESTTGEGALDLVQLISPLERIVALLRVVSLENPEESIDDRIANLASGMEKLKQLRATLSGKGQLGDECRELPTSVSSATVSENLKPLP
ncbi:hypothetical protein C8Q77DRAFT_892249 [Trametes polyzona]|nr:hypothetical protein C8Q77DRAFT_892249 [Trametes polyzona]